MINVICDYGQRGNILYLDAHCLATGLKYNQKVCLWNFEKFKDDYICKCSVENICSIQKPNYKIKLLYYIGKLLNKIGITADSDTIIKKIKKGKNVYILNWSFRNEQAFINYREDIVSFFSPKENLVKNISKKIDILKNTYDILVGVHIRRGDYQYWNGGKYYFDYNTYKKWMTEAYYVLREKGKLIFIIFSNEKVPEYFRDARFPIAISHGNALEDQYFMSRCDYIISTRTTFASWAEYMGHASRAYMLDKNDQIQKDSFKYWYN